MTRSPGRTGHKWRQARARVKGQVCAWCGKAIDRTLPHTDPLSFTVDHKLPLTLGGDPHDPDNLQPMHKRCNSEKGNGEGRRLPTSRRW